MSPRGGNGSGEWGFTAVQLYKGGAPGGVWGAPACVVLGGAPPGAFRLELPLGGGCVVPSRGGVEPPPQGCIWSPDLPLGVYKVHNCPRGRIRPLIAPGGYVVPPPG